MKTIFSHTGLMLFVYLGAMWPPVFLLIILVITNQMNFFAACSLIFGYACLIIPPRTIYKNAFVKNHMNSTVIKNKYITLRWNEIDSYEIINISVLQATGHPIKLTPVVCFKKTTAPFIGLNPRDCIFLELSKRNQRLLHFYSGKRNTTINEVLRLYSKEILK